MQADVPRRGLTDADWELIHELRMRGMIENPGDERVEILVSSGFATIRTTRLVITPEGRAAHRDWARCEPGSEAEERVQRAFERFLALNVELLQLCSDWQVKRGGTANDHTDAAYDWSVVQRLTALDERAGAVARHSGAAVPRLALYRSRLRAARELVEQGEHEWFTSPRIDSYHTVWMHWHEDLLLTLGRERDTGAT
ncbi:MAG TPA: MarR family transcriptional regulator [Acidimicrobiia bacterium]